MGCSFDCVRVLTSTNLCQDPDTSQDGVDRLVLPGRRCCTSLPYGPSTPRLAEPDVNAPGGANPLRTALRRLVLAAFSGTAALIGLLVGIAVLSATGLSFDP